MDLKIHMTRGEAHECGRKLLEECKKIDNYSEIILTIETCDSEFMNGSIIFTTEGIK